MQVGAKKFLPRQIVLCSRRRQKPPAKIGNDLWQTHRSATTISLSPNCVHRRFTQQPRGHFRFRQRSVD